MYRLFTGSLFRLGSKSPQYASYVTRREVCHRKAKGKTVQRKKNRINYQRVMNIDLTTAKCENCVHLLAIGDVFIQSDRRSVK